MDLVLVFIAGFLVGYAFTLALSIIFKSKPIGTLRVDQSDPDGPYLFLELDHGLNFEGKKEVTFEVKIEDYVPQK